MRTIVRIEGIITHLLFTHALRMRVKAQTHAEVSGRRIVTDVASDSSSSSIAVDQDGAHDGEISRDGGSTRHNGVEAVSTSVETRETRGNKGKAKGSHLSQHVDDDTRESSNFRGRLSNLVTTDLNNVVGGSYFVPLGKFHSDSFD